MLVADREVLLWQGNKGGTAGVVALVPLDEGSLFWERDGFHSPASY
jgi:hypothetical protein